MSFGVELKDQIPAITEYVGDGIQSLQQLRQFVRERSNIEREYAQKLENLAKKYKGSGKKATMTDASDEWDWNNNSSTCSVAWSSLLAQTDLIAQCHFKLVDELNGSVVEALKTSAAMKEEARKKHIAFYQKLKSERDKIYSDKDKAKQTYDDACAETENIRAKIDRGTGDQSKHQKQLDQALLDCYNSKNLYLLAIGMANAERSKYFEQDLSMIADQLQDLDRSRVFALQKMYTTYLNLEKKTLHELVGYYDTALESTQKMDPDVDAGVFIRDALGSSDNHDAAANVEFHFIPWNGHGSTTTDRDDHLVANDSATIFLNNKLIKNRKLLDTLADDLSKRSTEMMQLEKAVDAIDDRASTEYDTAKEKLVAVMRDITLLSTQKVRVKSEVDLIIRNIGDGGLQAQTHDFKPSSFTIPTTCDYCSSTIWGLSKQGLTCKACGFNCHAKCEMKVAPNCSRTRGKINRQKSISSASVRSVSSYKANPEATADNSRAESFTTPIAAPVQESTGQEPLARALYDYEAQTMEELSIMENDVLTVLEEDDGSGWIKARKGDQVGLVPANYVAHDDTVQDMRSSPDTPMTETSISFTPAMSTPAVEEPEPEPATVPEVVVALYDFEAVNADELNIRQGDQILVTKKDDSGWWEGTSNGKTGIFPANYVGPCQ
ncbi:uncharacterized protein BYT42DRAFT_582860 [Radiomyces spectabilis]|uniref:uncharacterized protein n=1 Tax=Radiomyces spectabilis TaxID=64574 RepID=UPI0022202197|nr:uncharacterized protein BYT42DRAFT_582860 [Radiomyces spectabilis]KAI8370561.1 hypothetical protein BYT42DRAFT_582860 [Radiomyces spectabilis]